MFDMFLEHRRIKTIARLLNQAGHRTRKGAKFSDNTVERLLRDPIAKGQRRANYTQSTGDGKHWTLKPEDEWVFSDVEPVVSAELWDQVNGILEGRKKTPDRLPAKKPVQLFAGVTFCACGGRMAVPSNSPKYICQKCHAKIPTADLEAVFQEQLKHFFFSPEDIATYLSRADDAMKGKEELLRTLEAEEQRTRRDMDRVMRLYLDDKLPQEAVSAQYRPLFDRVKQLEDEIPALQGELDFLKIQRLSTDEVLTEARDLYSRWESLSPEEKRQIVEQITERITVSTDEVHIRLCYLPSPAPKGNGPSGSSTPNSSSNAPGATRADGPSSSCRSGNAGRLGPQPCPCGFQGDPSKECMCSALQIQRYRAKISGPLLDRIDIQAEVPAVRYKELADQSTGESSANIRARVDAARDVQLARFHGRKIFCNAQMSARDLKKFCATEAAAEQLLERAMAKLGLSARAYTRILKVARTIADLDGAPATLSAAHVAEAIQYRSLDRSFH
jgi:hypothetical protein